MNSGASRARTARLAVEQLPGDAEPGVEERLARLEHSLGTQQAALDARLAGLTDAIAAMRQPLAPGEPARPEPIAAIDERLVPEPESTAAAAAQQQITMLSQALVAIEQSTTWRATAPLRKLGSLLSEPTRARLRRLARRTYWLLTPHRLGMRREWVVWAPQNEETIKRLAALSQAARERLKPLRRSYGPSAVEQLDIYPARLPNAPVFVFIHGGGWKAAEAKNAAFAADTFVNAGALYVVLDFIGIQSANGDLRVIAEQVRRGIAWVYRNAASFGGDPERLYLGGHSSGGHLCAAALMTDWPREFDLHADLVKGAVLMSGLYDLKPVRQSGHAPQVAFTDEIEEAMSPIRHLAGLRAPVIITCGGAEAPAFRQQSRDLFAAIKAAGKPADFLEAAHFGHLEMAESLGNPNGPNGRAALALMQLVAP